MDQPIRLIMPRRSSVSTITTFSIDRLTQMARTSGPIRLLPAATTPQQELTLARAGYDSGGSLKQKRAQGLRAVIDSGSVYNAQYNPAFVLIQYFGYLRRNPNNAPDNNFSGYDFWLNKMNQFSQPGEDVTNESVAFNRMKRAEMVKAFLVSKEYRERFQGGSNRGNQQGSIASADPADGLTDKIAKRMRFVFNVALLRALMPS